jgi:hypothetical protein
MRRIKEIAHRARYQHTPYQRVKHSQPIDCEAGPDAKQIELSASGPEAL